MLCDISLFLIHFTSQFVSPNPIRLSHPSPLVATSLSSSTSDTLLLTLHIFVLFLCPTPNTMYTYERQETCLVKANAHFTIATRFSILQYNL